MEILQNQNQDQDQDQDLRILRTMIKGPNYELIKLVYNSSSNNNKHTKLTSKQIRQKTGLTRKQVYSAISALKGVGVITRDSSSYYYRLTDIAFEIIKYIYVIEEIEAQKLQYKLKEIVFKDASVSPEEKAKIYEGLKI